MGRGLSNLSYNEGFKIEKEKFEEYKPILLNTLQATEIELTTRGLLDKVISCDATALIDGLVYGISLRFRSLDYNSFTLNRHYNDPFSEVHKWLQSTHQGNLKPIYYIQVNERPDKTLRLIRVNIDAFKWVLEGLIHERRLEGYYQPHLMAYEFPIDKMKTDWKGIHSSIIKP